MTLAGRGLTGAVTFVAWAAVSWSLAAEWMRALILKNSVWFVVAIGLSLAAGLLMMILADRRCGQARMSQAAPLILVQILLVCLCVFA